jgi:hypothetical protein
MQRRSCAGAASPTTSLLEVPSDVIALGHVNNGMFVLQVSDQRKVIIFLFRRLAYRSTGVHFVMTSGHRSSGLGKFRGQFLSH